MDIQKYKCPDCGSIMYPLYNGQLSYRCALSNKIFSQNELVELKTDKAVYLEGARDEEIKESC